jgi:VanZ family protein
MKRALNLLILAVYLVFLFSTLGVAADWWDYLESRFGVALYLTFYFFLIVILFFIAVRYLRINSNKPKTVLLSAALFIYGVMLYFLRELPVEQIHLIEYGLLSFLVYLSVPFKKPLKRYLFTLVAVSLIGYADEIVQFFLPGRYFTYTDVLVNALSGLCGIFLIYALKNEPSRGDT